MPDDRQSVRAGSNSYSEPTPLHGLTQGMTEMYGLVGGIDHRGIEWLRWLAAQPQKPRGLIVLAVYAGSPTWDNVLMDVLDIQQGSADRLRFNVIARRHRPDRPANLLLLRSNPTNQGTVVIGDVANLLVDTSWDDTDAVLVMPLTTVGTEAIRRQMDWTEKRSKPLTAETAPRLALPAGTEEGRRL